MRVEEIIFTVGTRENEPTVHSGIVGFGNIIARQLVRLLSGFRVSILAYDPTVRPDESQYPVKQPIPWRKSFHPAILSASYPAQ